MTIVEQGIDLMLFGMGTVFTFLLMLIVATKTMSALVKLLEGEPVCDSDDSISPLQNTSPELIAVISAAIAQHKAAKRK